MKNLHLIVTKNSFYQIFVFYCLVLLIKSTSHHCFYFKSISQPYDQHYYAARQRQIKNEIMEALRHVADNETLEGLIPKLFNLTNPDPTYVFLLPTTRKQRRLIMRKSDFEKATFPELSKVYIRLSRVHSKTFPDNQYFGPLHKSPYEPIFDKLQYDLEIDDKAIDRINENVQTERNFIDYVQRLNQKMAKLTPTVHKFDLIESESKIKAEVITFVPDFYSSAKNAKEKYKNKGEWEKLGLGGWKGDIIIPSETGPKSENISKNATDTVAVISPPPIAEEKRTKPTATIKQIDFTPTLQYNFLDDPEDNNIWDLPGKVSSDSGKLFALENETLSQMPDVLDHYNNPKWPIAFSRDSHKDDDVFIARANDPFGYSTKYKLRNSTRSGGERSEERKKRAVVDLYSMLKCATGCDPLIYKGYGCYCGFLGAGKPTDDIDKCCQQHDRCYDSSRCFAFQQYFVPYIWKCFQGQPVCATDHGEWGGPGSCASQLCKCDLALSKCLRKFNCPRRRAVCSTSKFRMLQNFLLIF